MPYCNSGIRVKFVGDLFPEYGYEPSQWSSQMFPNEMLTPYTFKDTKFVRI